jgi:hypothetical protein
MPEFAERAERAEARKRERLAPAVAAALARKEWMRPLAEAEIPEIVALGRQIVQQLPEAERRGSFQSGSGLAVPLVDPAERTP